MYFFFSFFSILIFYCVEFFVLDFVRWILFTWFTTHQIVDSLVKRTPANTVIVSQWNIRWLEYPNWIRAASSGFLFVHKCLDGIVNYRLMLRLMYNNKYTIWQILWHNTDCVYTHTNTHTDASRIHITRPWHLRRSDRGERSFTSIISIF